MNATTTTTPTTEDEPTADESQVHDEEKKLKRKIKWKRRAFAWGAFILLVAQIVTLIVAIFAAVPAFQIIFLKHSYSTVLTGSMTGTIDQGDLVVMREYHGEELNVGQIVGIQNPSGKFIHRIVEVNEDGSYKTQGDANDSADLFAPKAGKDSKDFWGVLETVHHQPMATAISIFAPDADWLAQLQEAASEKDLSRVIGLIPSAPWGFVALLAAVALFWWLIPDFINFLRNREGAKDELALELLKKQVEAHEGSLTEIEPVVDELKTDHDAAKAKEEEEARAFREALEAPLAYDPENLFDEPESAEEVDDTDAFLRDLQARHGTTGVTTRSSQNELPPLSASTPDPDEEEHRDETTAFDMDEVDDIRDLLK